MIITIKQKEIKIMNFKKTIIKRITTVALLLGLFAGLLPKNANAASITDDYSIKSVISSFFTWYESDDMSIESYSLPSKITKKVSKIECNDFLNKRGAGFLEAIDLMKQRKRILEETADIDVKEYNKKLFFTYKTLTQNENNCAVSVSVLKTWNYAFSPDKESGAIDEYDIDLSKEGATWKINEIKGITDSVCDAQLEALGKEISVSEKENYLNELKKSEGWKGASENKVHDTGKLIDSTTMLKAVGGYSRDKATKYAEKYALEPNTPKYPYFNGPKYWDCTNFTSQCLYAGGIKMHGNIPGDGSCWFINLNSKNFERSSSWAGADQFREYLDDPKCKIKHSISSWAKVIKGDLIQKMNGKKAEHSLFVSGYVNESNGARRDILICAHTENRKDVLLSQWYRGIEKKYYSIKGNK